MGEDILTTMPQPGDKKPAPAPTPTPMPPKAAPMAPETPMPPATPAKPVMTSGGIGTGMVIGIGAIALIIGALGAAIGMYYWNADSKAEEIAKVQAEAQTTVNALQTEINTTKAELVAAQEAVTETPTTLPAPDLNFKYNYTENSSDVVVYDGSTMIETINLEENFPAKALLLNQTSTEVFFSIYPGVDADFNPYMFGPTALYSYNIADKKITNIVPIEENLIIEDVSNDGLWFAYRYRSEEDGFAAKKAVGLENISTAEKFETDLPEEISSFGDLSISPNSKLVAFSSVVYKGDAIDADSSGAIRIFNTITKELTTASEGLNRRYFRPMWQTNNPDDVIFKYFPTK